MNKEEQLKELNITIEQAKAIVDKASSLKTLLKDKDFKSVILDGYFKDEASRLALLKGDNGMSKPEDQAYLDRMFNGIGSLHSYFQSIFAMGKNAENAINSYEETKEEIIKEDIYE